MKVFLSPLAEKKALLLLEYLEDEWSKKVRDEFLSKLLDSFSLISNYPKSCVASKSFPNIYKCVVTKQCSFFYRIKSNEIEVITLFDNRQNPDTIQKELKNYFK